MVNKDSADKQSSQMRNLKAVFFGTPEFALPSLQVTAKNTDLIAVISQPDRPRGRGNNVLASEVKAWAQEHVPNAKIFTPLSLSKKAQDKASINCREYLLNCQADLFIVTAYGNILPKTILEVPKLCSLNLHGSLLPRWRGAAPIQRALEAGDSQTGIALQKMVYQLDAGAVLLEQKMPLGENMDAVELSAALSKMSGQVLNEFFNKLPSSSEITPADFMGFAQDEKEVSYAHKISKEDGYWKLDWAPRQAHNKCRAFRAWPRVEALMRSKEGGTLKAKVLKTALSKNESLPPLKPGELFISGKQLYVGCTEPLSPLEILELQVPGKGGAPGFQVLENLEKKLDSLLELHRA